MLHILYEKLRTYFKYWVNVISHLVLQPSPSATQARGLKVRQNLA